MRHFTLIVLAVLAMATVCPGAADRIISGGTTSVILDIPIRNSTTGALKTGIAFGDATVKFQRDGVATATTVTLSDGTLGTFGASTWKETQIGGLYQLCLADAAFAVGANGVTITITASGAIDKTYSVALDAGVNISKVGGSTTPVTNLDTLLNSYWSHVWDGTNKYLIVGLDPDYAEANLLTTDENGSVPAVLDNTAFARIQGIVPSDFNDVTVTDAKLDVNAEATVDADAVATALFNATVPGTGLTFGAFLIMLGGF